VISDIVSDEPVPEAMQSDPELWSGCLSGALTEEGFLAAFEDAGFHGMRILSRSVDPWRTVEGIEFRSVTLEAFKGKAGSCLERNQAVIYLGPFKEMVDDDDHRLVRGQRYAVCDKTFNLYAREPYRDQFVFIEPLEEVPLAEAEPFDCSRDQTRQPRETKGVDYRMTSDEEASCCGPEGCC
jgi:arsenite methyltransferase